MKLNNKGMAISGILYSILVLFIVLIFGVLSVLASTKYSYDKFRNDIMKKLNYNIRNSVLFSYNDVNSDYEIDAGDEIKIGSESFYIISNDGTNIKAIAKYNLYVGATYDGTNLTNYGDKSNGIQGETMKGWSGDIIRYGVTNFSSDIQKGTEPADYLGSIVEGYVNAYKIKLESYGTSLTDISLITKDELVSLGCSLETNNCSNAPEWVYSTSYWTKTKDTSDTVWRVNFDNYMGPINVTNNDFGVRPLITVTRSDIDLEDNENKTKYSEKILNGADPVLDKGMIPVTISNDGIVKKADLYSEWYKYSNDINDSKWANAVLVTNDSRDTYKNADANSIIKPEDIRAYLVWIPRYKYAIPTVTDKNNPPLINIIFEGKNKTKSSGDAIGINYLTHPAFTFGNDELNGIWVGKFETTVDSNSECGTCTGNDDCPTKCQNIKSKELSILPSIKSLRYQSVNTQFNTALKFKDYGLLGDAHMMKNIEWGAVAYLSHSKYGLSSEIRINNNNAYKTGCGAISDNASDSFDCGIEYGKASAYPQSTTGNITGIFDMSGGSWDRVMGNFNSTSSKGEVTTFPNAKYYDLFKNDSYATACNGNPCRGHANYETEAWYGDYNFMIVASHPWVVRGGNSSSNTTGGIFHTINSEGDAVSNNTFRLTITN